MKLYLSEYEIRIGHDLLEDDCTIIDVKFNDVWKYNGKNFINQHFLTTRQIIKNEYIEQYNLSQILSKARLTVVEDVSKEFGIPIKEITYES